MALRSQHLRRRPQACPLGVLITLAARAAACGEDWGVCMRTQCCQGRNYTCFEKNGQYAKCMPSCQPGVHPDDKPPWNTAWSCRILPEVKRSWSACTTKGNPGPAKRSAPQRPATIYCWALTTPGTYERELIATQFKQGSGIFGCDGYTLVSNTTAVYLFPPEIASKLHVSIVDMPLYVKSVHGPLTEKWNVSLMGPTPKHLLNTPVFIQAWRKIFLEGLYRKFDWTLKLDVDAFIVPVRMRTLLSGYPKRPTFLLNALVDMYDNLLHGPVEAVNRAGMEVYEARHLQCVEKFGQMQIGEDFYLRKCLGELRLHGVQELRLLVDAYAWGWDYVPCDMATAVYHPIKSRAAWLRCVHSVCSGAKDPWTGIAGPDPANPLAISDSLWMTDADDGSHQRTRSVRGDWLLPSIAGACAIVVLAGAFGMSRRYQSGHERSLEVDYTGLPIALTRESTSF